MAFMEPEIYRGEAWEIETRDGTWIVPTEVAGGFNVAVNQTIDRGDPRFPGLVKMVADYVEPAAERIESITRRRGYLARLSAPGYLDCTDWTLHSSLRAARASLRDE